MNTPVARTPQQTARLLVLLKTTLDKLEDYSVEGFEKRLRVLIRLPVQPGLQQTILAEKRLFARMHPDAAKNFSGLEDNFGVPPLKCRPCEFSSADILFSIKLHRKLFGGVA